ncbi:hypothetical protein [Chelativorans intermedius]|uniref:Uncharacterized protein n=1 Tax=Chelativorans intermedius TaxID=515947 RepID=A0ABV6D4V7_9HYPH|nr:hypothetical protein [Chelativorans intermedius]MCT8999011.1 hypothetical protein [Chelativorans intermedius]
MRICYSTDEDPELFEPDWDVIANDLRNAAEYLSDCDDEHGMLGLFAIDLLQAAYFTPALSTEERARRMLCHIRWITSYLSGSSLPKAIMSHVA